MVRFIKRRRVLRVWGGGVGGGGGGIAPNRGRWSQDFHVGLSYNWTEASSGLPPPARRYKPTALLSAFAVAPRPRGPAHHHCSVVFVPDPQYG